MSYWDIYYNSIPGVSRAQTHNSLGLELDIIIKALPPKKPSLLQGRGFEEFFKAILSRKNCKKDEYSTRLGKLACEILTTGIRAATGAVRPNFHL
ncbi:unnamed protein product [Rhizophagus irregularis]|nr:unnamed protein product [Rhizophagus irregularis]